MAFIYNGILPQAPKKVKTFRAAPLPPKSLQNRCFFRDVLSRFFSFRHFSKGLCFASVLSKLYLPQAPVFKECLCAFCALCQTLKDGFFRPCFKVNKNYLSIFFKKASDVNFPQSFVQTSQIMNAFFYISKNNFFSRFI